MSPKANVIDAYLADQPEPQRSTLEEVRRRIAKVLPHADEGMSYGMPAFLLDGKGVAGFAGLKAHCSYFPMSGAVVGAAGDLLDGYATSKGGVQFPADKPLAVGVIRALVKLRLAELADVRNGVRSDYFDDGRLKAQGKVKDGELNGDWRWYRKDGSLLRTGTFKKGEQTGTWQTWKVDGTVATTKSY